MAKNPVMPAAEKRSPVWNDVPMIRKMRIRLLHRAKVLFIPPTRAIRKVRRARENPAIIVLFPMRDPNRNATASATHAKHSVEYCSRKRNSSERFAIASVPIETMPPHSNHAKQSGDDHRDADAKPAPNDQWWMNRFFRWPGEYWAKGWWYMVRHFGLSGISDREYRFWPEVTWKTVQVFWQTNRHEIRMMISSTGRAGKIGLEREKSAFKYNPDWYIVQRECLDGDQSGRAGYRYIHRDMMECTWGTLHM